MTTERPTDDFDGQVAGVAALSEPVRRALYRHVVAQPDPVNRDQAAQAVEVPRHVAKFHLDKLVEEGLLDIEFRRPPGRGGPGAGRPAKLYRRSQRQVAVSLPARDYELVGRLLAEAVIESDRLHEPVAEVLGRTARERGAALAQQVRRRVGDRPSRVELVTAMVQILDQVGYEPRQQPDGLIMANCPFDALAKDYTGLVCGINLNLLEGLVDGLGGTGLKARLEPAPGRCCVQLCRIRRNRGG